MAKTINQVAAGNESVRYRRSFPNGGESGRGRAAGEADPIGSDSLHASLDRGSPPVEARASPAPGERSLFVVSRVPEIRFSR